MRVFVLSKEGRPLMPTTPRRARLWLKARRAKVVRHEPFTIQLRFATTGYRQSVTVGVDSGSKTVGIAAIANGETLLQAEMRLRTDISEKLTQSGIQGSRGWLTSRGPCSAIRRANISWSNGRGHAPIVGQKRPPYKWNISSQRGVEVQIG